MFIFLRNEFNSLTALVIKSHELFDAWSIQLLFGFQIGQYFTKLQVPHVKPREGKFLTVSAFIFIEIKD